MMAVMAGVMMTGTAQAMCLADATARYGVPEHLLRAVMQVESAGRALPPSRNADGSYDIGVMRINSRWLPILKRHGITRESLDDACQNIHVGAWILANNRQRYGANWTAVGAYNVGCGRLDQDECDRRRALYNWKVYCAMMAVADARCGMRAR